MLTVCKNIIFYVLFLIYFISNNRVRVRGGRCESGE